MSSPESFIRGSQQTLHSTLAVQLSFHIFAAVGFTSFLPFRKKFYLAGSDVVERQAVGPMAEATFFLGCSLSLSQPSAAEFALNDFLEPFFTWVQVREDPGLTSIGSILLKLRSSLADVSPKSAVYEEVFADAIASLDSLLDPDAAIGVLQESVLRGLFCGLLHSEHASAMLTAWVDATRRWDRLGAGGLRVQQTTSITTVEGAYDASSSLFNDWPGSAAFGTTAEKAADSEAGGAPRSSSDVFRKSDEFPDRS